VRVLVVNTLPLIQEALRIVIQKIMPSSEVLYVREPTIALSLIHSQANIDWVVLDIDNYTGPSLTAVKSIRASDPSIRVVTMSVKDDPEIVELSLRAGSSGHISKSDPIDSVIDSVQKMLAGEPVGRSLQSHALHAAQHTSHSATSAHHSLAQEIGIDLDSMHHAAPSLAAIGDLNLTHRQRDVLSLLLSGKRNKVIGEELDIESSTVKAHVSGILRALNVQNRTEAVLLAKRMGFGGAVAKS
jgi:DNA-binding NarL/FixJ family response regulator